MLGVEGIDRGALIEAIINSGAHIIDHVGGSEKAGESETRASAAPEYSNCYGEEQGDAAISTDSGITKLDFYEYGLTGGENSAKYREEILASLGLPKYLTVNAMIAALNCLFTKREFEEYLEKLNKA